MVMVSVDNYYEFVLDVSNTAILVSQYLSSLPSSPSHPPTLIHVFLQFFWLLIIAGKRMLIVFTSINLSMQQHTYIIPHQSLFPGLFYLYLMMLEKNS